VIYAPNDEDFAADAGKVARGYAVEMAGYLS
jgi:hypothetical protein